MTHIVEQGEYLSGIARRYGFSSHRAIWFHPENAELRRKRLNPNILFPGDPLFIPDQEDKQVQCPTEKRHVFQKSGEKLKLRLMLKDIYNGPVSNSRCELRLQDLPVNPEFFSKGRLEQGITPVCEAASIILRAESGPLQDRVAEVKIGHLDPIEEPSGQAARLKNLGYYRASVGELDELEFRSAVEEFQCDHGLAVDGKCGAQTQAKLKAEYGC